MLRCSMAPRNASFHFVDAAKSPCTSGRMRFGSSKLMIPMTAPASPLQRAGRTSAKYMRFRISVWAEISPMQDVAHTYGDHARFGRLDVTKKELKALRGYGYLSTNSWLTCGTEHIRPPGSECEGIMPIAVSASP